MSEVKTGIAAGVMNAFWKDMDAKKAYIPTRDKKTIGAKSFERGKVTGNTWIIKQDVVSIPPDFLQSLGAAELKMVCKIMSELKKCNAFWHYPYREIGGKLEKTIGTLRSKGILFKTENLAMHLVNPEKIRRGAYDFVVAATTKLIEESSTISLELYKHLQTPEKAYVNGYISLLDS